MGQRTTEQIALQAIGPLVTTWSQRPGKEAPNRAAEDSDLKQSKTALLAR